MSQLAPSGCPNTTTPAIWPVTYCSSLGLRATDLWGEAVSQCTHIVGTQLLSKRPELPSEQSLSWFVSRAMTHFKYVFTDLSTFLTAKQKLESRQMRFMKGRQMFFISLWRSMFCWLYVWSHLYIRSLSDAHILIAAFNKLRAIIISTINLLHAATSNLKPLYLSIQPKWVIPSPPPLMDSGSSWIYIYIVCRLTSANLFELSNKFLCLFRRKKYLEYHDKRLFGIAYQIIVKEQVPSCLNYPLCLPHFVINYFIQDFEYSFF